MAAKRAPKRVDVTMETPDLGLSSAQIKALKKSFQNDVVNTLLAAAPTPRGYVVDMRIQVKPELGS
jgi:hypothetical protein